MKLKKYRYCLNCKKLTKFEFNKVVSHGECKECGHRFALKDTNKIHNQLQREHQRMIINANKWYNDNLNKLKQLKNGIL
jgi:DNA-directed RNA polymerase subunit RPC12/RpoP